MERLAAPQTHLSLKAMIKEVDEDQDGKLSFREVNILVPATYTSWFLLCFFPRRSVIGRLWSFERRGVGQVSPFDRWRLDSVFFKLSKMFSLF